nr:hypothetical protein [Streptomyces taklimakanensis]
MLSYEAARRLVHLPTCRWGLENRVAESVERLRERAATTDVVFLDHTTNGDVDDRSVPLSHAALLRLYIRGERPCEGEGVGPAVGPA